jgi:hypothetical protein
MRRFLTILAAGTLALSACSDDTVGPPPNYVFVVIPDQADISLNQDDSAAVSVVVKDTVSGGHMYSPNIDWSSDDPDVAVVESGADGWQVRAIGAGSTQLHAVFNAYHGPVEGTINVSVTGVPAESFTLGSDPADLDVALYPGDADTLQVHIHDADDNDLTARRITWENSAEAVASVETFAKVTVDTVVVGTDTTFNESVSYWAVVTADSLGDAEIVGDVGGMQQTINVTVTPRPVAKVVMSPDVAGLHVGEKVKITATPKGANGEALTGRTIGWTSTNELVATVDSTGVVTAVGAGNAQIKALVEGVFGTTSVIVIASPGT